MTPNELEFFGRLLNAFPEYFVFPQVAMSALIQGETRGDFLRIAQQRVDYVLSDQFGDVIAVVELDDRTHSLTKDKVRDRRLSQAGIRTIRFESRAKPSPEEIRAMVLSNLDQRPPLATQRSAIEQAGMAHRSTSTNVVHIGGRTPAKSNFAWIALAWIAVVAILFVALRQLEAAATGSLMDFGGHSQRERVIVAWERKIGTVERCQNLRKKVREVGDQFPDSHSARFGAEMASLWKEVKSSGCNLVPN